MRLNEVVRRKLMESYKVAEEVFMKQHDDSSTVKMMLQMFKENKDKAEPPKNDISYWIKKGFPSFYVFTQRLAFQKSKGDRKKEIERGKGQAIEILDNDKATAVIPLSRASSCYHGRNGNWCISSEGNEEFWSYTQMGKTYVIIEPKEVVEENHPYAIMALEIDGSLVKLWSKENNIIMEYNEYVGDREELEETYRELDEFLLEMTGEGLAFYEEEVNGMFVQDEILNTSDEERDEEEFINVIHSEDFHQIMTWITERDMRDDENYLEPFTMIMAKNFLDGVFTEDHLGEYVAEMFSDAHNPVIENAVVKGVIREILDEKDSWYAAEIVVDYLHQIKKEHGGLKQSELLDRLNEQIFKLVGERMRRYQPINDFIDFYNHLEAKGYSLEISSEELNTYMDRLAHYGTQIKKYNRDMFRKN